MQRYTPLCTALGSAFFPGSAPVLYHLAVMGSANQIAVTLFPILVTPNDVFSKMVIIFSVQVFAALR